MLQFSHFRTYIGQHEEQRIVGVTRQSINTFVCQFDGFVLLIDHEVQHIGGDMHVLLVLLQVELLGFLQTNLYALLAQVLDQCLVLRHTFERAEQSQLTFLANFLVR